MTFNLKSVGAKEGQKVSATVQGSLTDDEVMAVLRVVPLMHHVRSLVGPWMLSIVGDDSYAKVVVRAVWDCGIDANAYKDWVPRWTAYATSDMLGRREKLRGLTITSKKTS